MAKGKLILICQSGGEFVKSDDGSLQYDGGEAQAVNVNRDTLFDDLKLKLAETCNLEYKSVSIKYFLPGNSRTLITLANAKDLKRMLDFHGNSVTADIFVLGREGFIRDALDARTIRETGIKIAEYVNWVVAPTAAATSSPNDAANPVCTPTARVRGMRMGSQKKVARAAIGKTASQKKTTRVATARTASQKKATTCVATGKTASQKKTAEATKSSPLSETVCALNIAAHEDSDYFRAALSSPDSFAAKATSHSSTEVDLDATPADSVKKRRRTASWKIGMNSPTVVVVPDAGDKIPRKKVNRRLVGEGYMKKSKEIVPRNNGFGTSSHVTVSDDVSAEQLVASWKDGITGIGQDFMDVSEFRDVLQKYAIAHRFAYRLKKNETNRASGRCVAEGCSWRIHASWVPSAQSFTIRKFNNTHTCGGKSWKSAHPPKNWLVNIIKDKLRDSPNHKPKEIADGISRDFGIELNYTQLWRGIGDARKQLQGSYREAYNQLSWYCEKIMETNPGSYAKLNIGDDKRFRCLFVSFHASIQGFLKGCRPLLFLESMSLKSKRQEVLLTATALDGDDGFFPVAFAIVDVDTDDNWYWFLGHLRSALPTSDPITFVSDREKGLKESVLKAFGNAYNGYSMYHLLESFKKSLKGPFHGDGRGSLPVNFVAAAHAVRPLGFKKFTEQIKHVSPQAYDWVMQVERENWASTSFKGERYNHITQNVGELYIKLMEEAREVPITQKIEALISMMINLISTRQADSSNWSTELTPSKNEKLQEEIFDARGLKVLFSSDTLFEVHQDVNHVVNLEKCECTCLGWQTSGLPCCHAVAVFNSARRCLYDHCSKYFTVDSYRLTYAEPIKPVPSAGKAEENEVSDSDTTEHVLPPCPSRLPSQPKPKQAKRPGETKRVVICSRCKEAGHNKASCKATL